MAARPHGPVAIVHIRRVYTVPLVLMCERGDEEACLQWVGHLDIAIAWVNGSNSPLLLPCSSHFPPSPLALSRWEWWCPLQVHINTTRGGEGNIAKKGWGEIEKGVGVINVLSTKWFAYCFHGTTWAWHGGCG